MIGPSRLRSWFRPRPERPARLLVAVLLCGAVTLAWAALHVTHGLQAQYFNDPNWTAPIVRTGIDDTASTAVLTARWSGAPPSAFSAEWSGYLAVGRSGRYTFATTSDDGSWLYVDGQLVVSNGGRHAARTRIGTIDLGPGPHFVLLRYFQDGGGYELNWAWAAAGGFFHPVASWRVTPLPHVYGQLLADHLLGWVWGLCALAVLFTLPWSQWRRAGRRIRRAPGRHPAAACFVLFVALAVFETWPLATNPAHLCRNDNADTQLNEWTLAWVVHEAPRHPLRLFDANIFYPNHLTLAYSESMLTQSAMAAPLQWLGASPVLTYNLLLLAGFVLTGWATSFLMARWTGDWIAGVASGIFAAFNAHTFTRLPHMQIQHVEFFPLALLALDALLREPRVRHAVWLAVWYVLQAFTSVYLLVFTGMALLVGALARPEDWLGSQARRLWPRAALAVALASAALVPYLWPYWLVVHDQGLTRTLADTHMYAGSWRDYLTTPANIDYRLWSHHWFSTTALFPGWIALALATVAMATGTAFRDRRARMCLAFGVCGVVLSFGTKLPGYALLYHLVPILQAIRAPARFGYLGIVTVAILAGFGLALLRRRLTGARTRALVSAVIIAAAIVETNPAPIYLSHFDHIPPIYNRLRHVPGAVIAEFPFYSPAAVFHNGEYLLDSTLNWRPMLNGYSGFIPASYARQYKSLGSFPSAASVASLRADGVTDIFVRRWYYSAAQLDALNANPAVHLIVTDPVDDISLYTIGLRASGSGLQGRGQDDPSHR